MWVARDKDGILNLFRDYPKRLLNIPKWRKDNNTIILDSNLFPLVKWDNEPLEVCIIPTKNIDISNLPTPLKVLCNELINYQYIFKEFQKTHKN